MVAAIDSKSIAVWRAGSIPAGGTKERQKQDAANGRVTCSPGVKPTRQGNGRSYVIRTGPIPGNLKQCVMSKIKKIPDNGTFHFSNLNPKGNGAGDCVIRSISAFLHWDWERTYRELAERGIKTGYLINDDENYQSFLAEKGFEKHKQPRRGNGNKYTAADFCKEIAEPGKTYILRLANHLTFVGPDRKIWDAWDCGFKTVGNYWESENIGY